MTAVRHTLPLIDDELDVLVDLASLARPDSIEPGCGAAGLARPMHVRPLHRRG